VLLEIQEKNWYIFPLWLKNVLYFIQYRFSASQCFASSELLHSCDELHFALKGCMPPSNGIRPSYLFS